MRLENALSPRAQWFCSTPICWLGVKLSLCNGFGLKAQPYTVVSQRSGAALLEGVMKTIRFSERETTSTATKPSYVSLRLVTREVYIKSNYILVNAAKKFQHLVDKYQTTNIEQKFAMEWWTSVRNWNELGGYEGEVSW